MRNIDFILDRFSGAVRLILSKLRVVQLKPWDTSTPEGRSKERYRRATLTTATSLVSKAASMLTLLVSVPLTIGYLGAERYGIWMTITSTVALLGFADFGIGNGLMTTLADALGREDNRSAQTAIASAFWMLGGIAAFIALGLAVVYPFVNWAGIFNVHSDLAIRETGPTLIVVLGCFALNLPLGIVSRIEGGTQSGYIQNLWVTFGSLVALAGLLTAVSTHAGLPMLVLSVSSAPVIAAIGNGAQLLRKYSWVRPSLPYCNKDSMGSLLRVGLMFFIVQVSIAVAYQSDNLVIAHYMSARMVTPYAVPARMFSVVAIILSVLMAPLWPAYAEAIAKGDRAWIAKAFRRSLSVSFIIAFPIVSGLVVFGNLALKLWIGGRVQASILLLALFGARCLMSAFLYPVSMLLNGLGEMKFQATTSAIMAIVNITFSILWVKHYGIIGAIAGTVFAETLISALPSIYVVRRILRDLKSPGLSSESAK